MYHACEDGNSNTGDGCIAHGGFCEVEYGWECGQGDPIEWDYCKEICGDGHDMGTYMCDDGNINSGDGCDQLCCIEDGFQCDQVGTLGTYGNQPSVNAVYGGTLDVPDPDICYEICGDGKDFGYYECDDGNLVNGDGCDDTCTIEPGFECYDGTSINKDTCYEICGDGDDYYKYPCDDGNVINGDGCDKLC